MLLMVSERFKARRKGESQAFAITALILGCFAVAASCIFIDRPVAIYIQNHRFYSEEFLRWPLLVAAWLKYSTFLGIVGIAAWRLLRPGGDVQKLLLCIAFNLVATEGIKEALKWTFGRTAPCAINDPSLNACGFCDFHPFHVGFVYQAFPSGHAAATFAVVSILWLSRPRWRPLCAAVGGLLCVALVALNYHYVGDVLAGAILGSVTGFWMARLFRLSTKATA